MVFFQAVTYDDHAFHLYASPASDVPMQGGANFRVKAKTAPATTDKQIKITK